MKQQLEEIIESLIKRAKNSPSLRVLIEEINNLKWSEKVLKKVTSPSPEADYPKLSALELAAMIDHTLLNPDASSQDVEKVCQQALHYQFATVCLRAHHIAFASKLLQNSKVKPISVIDFPLGKASASEKAAQAREAIQNGAAEIDMVIDIPRLKAKEYAEVLNQIRAVVEASKNYPVKVILETGALEREEKIIGCALSKAAGAAFVKTSTGYGPGGATVEDVALMRKIVGPEMGVKASGGIRTTQDALKMIHAGANRIGASQSVAIVEGATHSKKNSVKDGSNQGDSGGY